MDKNRNDIRRYRKTIKTNKSTNDRVMTKGKNMWCEFACILQFCIMLREMGHTACALSIYCWDRGVYGPLSRLCPKTISTSIRQPKSAKKLILKFIPYNIFLFLDILPLQPILCPSYLSGSKINCYLQKVIK